MDFSPDGRNLYVAQQAGQVFVVRDELRLAAPFIDISAQVNGTRDRGLLDIAIHPDFENSPYVYLLFAYDPPEVYQNASHPLAGPDRNGNRAGRLIRVTADAATNYTTAVSGSEVVLLGSNSVWSNFNAFVNSTSDFNEAPAGILPDGTNIQDFIATDSESHTVGSVEFGPDGALYVSIGDGTSYNRVDPRTVRVQDIDNLSGKILRLDPLTGQGLADNPFFNGDLDANRSKVYQFGLRNPFRISFDSVTEQMYVGDVGWTRWEEINAAGPGANFGWPYFEGGNGANLRTGGYEDLSPAQVFYGSGQTVQAPLLGLSHAATGINAIVAGAVYRGDAYPEQYQGNLFYNDLGQGIVSNIAFNPDGSVASVGTFTTGARYVTQIIQGLDGNLYYVDLDDGLIGRWVFI
jgi:glucose/arabinose dehydrogenase